MSRELGLKALNLEPTDKIPHTEYMDHVGFMEAKTGRKYDPAKPMGLWPKFWEAMDLDWVWYTSIPHMDGPWTDMGMAVWDGDGIRDHTVQCPFKDVDELLNFDAVKVYGLCDIEKRVKKYQARYDQLRKDYPQAIVSGGIYRSLVSFCIDAFGWEMFLLALATDVKKFAKVTEGMAEVILSYVKAWAKIDIDFFLTHDDIAWTSGAFTHPSWYAENVFVYFKEYWKVIHDAGKKVLYCADGDYTEFIDDIAEAGADGFIFEPTTDLKYICENYGKTHVIIGNADCRVATFGTKQEIAAEIDRCVQLGKNCPGFFFAWGNHLPANIPMENVEFAFEYFEKVRNR